MSPLEIDKMAYWEYEMFMKELQELVESQNKEQQAEMDKYHVNDMMKKAQNPNKMMPKQPEMPKMPNMNMSMPKF